MKNLNIIFICDGNLEDIKYNIILNICPYLIKVYIIYYY